uniref:Uncharacterized protein n=1 Tax=Rhizophora mucronata TaxID=61149 RepID=A0A2P2R5A3_RHIMU
MNCSQLCKLLNLLLALLCIHIETKSVNNIVIVNIYILTKLF